jgi:hypothetical protein
MLAAVLLAIAEPDEAQRRVLETLVRQTARNVRGLEVGELRAVSPFPVA